MAFLAPKSLGLPGGGSVFPLFLARVAALRPCKAWPELALVLAQGFKWRFVLGKNSTIDSFQGAEFKLNLI